MRFNIILMALLIFGVISSCDDSPIEPYFPPVIEDEIEDEDDQSDENIYDNFIWIKKIRPDHPRLFFNNDTFKDVKNKATNEEKAAFESIKRRIDGLIGKEIIFQNPFEDDGTNFPDHTIGYRAAEAAFIYHITGDNKYFDLSRNLLLKVIEFYELRNSNKLNISWFSHSRIHAIMAYDWLYNDFSDDDKKNIGTALFDAIEFMLPDTPRSNFFREYRGPGIAYSNQSLRWYLGLVFHKTGVNDDKAVEYLQKGYKDLQDAIIEKKLASGDDGGVITGTLAYSMADSPWGVYNYFEVFNSATGYNIAKENNYFANNINYVFWNRLPKNRHFGFGDDRHDTNSMDYPVLNYHLSRFLYLYGDLYPSHASMTKWVIEEYFPPTTTEVPSYSMARFFLNNSEAIKASDPSPNLPLARYFEAMGQIFMRSGSGDDDTYATFTVSPAWDMLHKHYDNNNFMIYKKGFQTIDSGTRPDGNHLSHYYGRTVAHNCITIRMPGEVIPKYWGAKAPHEAVEPMPNDGGQNSIFGTNVISFDESKHYAYIASDATGSYNSTKTNLVLRQFLFLPPDNFVIFDRVNSTNPEYSKRWLLHTAYRPEHVSENEFYSSHEEGRLICKTIYPENANSELIGGPGKQFWSDGKNWPLPYGGDSHPLFGQWRIEVTPSEPSRDDIFLHVIQVGDRAADVKSISSAEKYEETGMKGVKFSYKNKEFKVLFTTSGQPGGKIQIIENRNTIVNENFTTGVKDQNGLAYR